MSSARPLFAALLALLALPVLAALPGCEREADATEVSPLEGAAAEPPFRVTDSARDIVFTYAGPSGPVSVESVAEVPAEAREHVRVASLKLPPSVSTELVYVADLRSAGTDGAYPVRVVSRAAFDEYVAGSEEPTEARAGSGDVVLYGASWCGACAQARAYFQEKGIAFVDRDIERDPGAREEMQRKADAAGVSTRGIPVIDFRGTILPGFARQRLDQLIDG